jgi:hypothetical protein
VSSRLHALGMVDTTSPICAMLKSYSYHIQHRTYLEPIQNGCLIGVASEHRPSPKWQDTDLARRVKAQHEDTDVLVLAPPYK